MKHLYYTIKEVHIMPEEVLALILTIWNWFLSILPDEIAEMLDIYGVMPLAD